MKTKGHKVPALPKHVEDWLAARRCDPGYRQRAIDLLLQLVQVDTTPKPSPAANADAERQVFEIITGHLAGCVPEARIERLPIRTDIGDHPYFTMPYYAVSELTSRDREGAVISEAQQPLPGGRRSESTAPVELIRHVYSKRCNVLVRVPNPGRKVLAFNAHIDTVAPNVAGRSEGEIVSGRGSLDDKGSCLVMMLALEWLAEIASQWEIRPACELLCEFVIDEETGGNGSLSLALEKDRASCNAIVVLEPTQLRIHPANRGVVWYMSRLDAADTANKGRDILLEAMSFVVGALGDCGDRLKAESDDPLFPHKPVQTCHGMLAHYGQHPSRVNDYIPLRLTWQGAIGAEVRTQVTEGLADYCKRYGDKTKPGASETLLEQHLAWSKVSDQGADLEIFGLAGHMGSVDRLDGAITKAATIIRKLVEARQHKGRDWQSLSITLKERRDLSRLVIEGGQGFVPTHTMEDVSNRMRQAVSAGVRSYVELVGLPDEAISYTTSFDKLHNASFVGPLNGPALNALLSIGQAMGFDSGEALRGFDASCDARIFAREFPGTEVITFGPGNLAYAHANDEHVEIKGILTAAESLVRLALSYPGER